MFAKVAKLIAVNVALLLAVLLGAELAFGTWFSRDPLDRLGLVRNFSTTVSAASLYDGGGDFPYRRDRWGFRGAVDPAKVTVVTIGGSTTNQLYLPEDKTWQAVMERTLHASGRGDVVVANAGIDGQSTIGHLRVLRDWLPNVPGLRPRFILAYVGINDVHITGAWVDDLAQHTLIRKIRQRSAVWGLVDKVSGMMVARRAKLTHQPVAWDKAEWTDRPGRPDWRSDQAASAPESYRHRLKEMAGLIHQLGAVPVFVTQARGDYRIASGKLQGLAAGDGPNGIDQYHLLAGLNRVTLDVCREDGLLCLDLARDLSFGAGDFYDLLHNTPQGAEKIGRWLAERLAGLV